MLRRVLLIATGVIATLTLAAGPVFADASPPTDAGKDAGHSGQCTKNPDDRPAVCPAT
jgi:hypothetical protein